MAVASDGSYGIPQGVVYSFPVRIDHGTKDWSIVQGLNIDDFSREKMNATLKELEEEKGEALAACEH
jgi:malate/lactate dehydrogenase